MTIDQCGGAELAMHLGEQPAQRAMVRLIERLDPAQRVVDGDALVVDFLRVADHARHGAEPAGDPLCGAETFAVNWANYDHYTSAYLEGERGAPRMRDRLLDAVPPPLAEILAGRLPTNTRSRTWFHSDAPELNQLPWELLAYADGARPSSHASFVRGIPPETASPSVPVTGPSPSVC